MGGGAGDHRWGGRHPFRPRQNGDPWTAGDLPLAGRGLPGWELGQIPLQMWSGDGSITMPVLWAAKAGITTGVDATHFRPNQSCTRGQVATFLYREFAE